MTPEPAPAYDLVVVGGGISGLAAAFEPVLQAHRRRFEATRTEEGSVMAATLAYVIGDLRTSRRAEILRDFRSSGQILQLFRQGVAELASALTSGQ